MNFAYLRDVFYDNDEHFIEPYMSTFNIYFINTEPFNMGLEENSHMSRIPKDVTPRTIMRMNNNKELIIMMKWQNEE